MLTFYGQPKFKSDGATRPPIGYELFIREHTAAGWQLPKDFNAITVAQLKALLLKTIPLMPASVVSIAFNLEPAQFIDHNYINMVAEVQQTTSLILYTELTERADERVTVQQLLAAAKYFHNLNLQVCVDDVGSGRNTLGLVLALNDYVDEYKFACQNFRFAADFKQITEILDPWYALAQRHKKVFAIEGIETAAELAIVDKDYPCDIVQGYYTGKPVPLNIEV